MNLYMMGFAKIGINILEERNRLSSLRLEIMCVCFLETSLKSVFLNFHWDIIDWHNMIICYYNYMLSRFGGTTYWFDTLVLPLNIS